MKIIVVEEVRNTFARATHFTALDVGHGALGFTLALATGRIVADLVAGRPSPIPLDGFTLDKP